MAKLVSKTYGDALFETAIESGRLDEYFEEALKTQPEALYYSEDGVHPNINGRIFIGELYAKAVKPLIDSL